MTGLRELAEVAQVVATRIRQDASNIGVDIRNPRLAMENHARDLDRLAEKLAAHPAEPASVASPKRVAKVLNDHYYDVAWSKEHQGFRCVCGWLGEDHVGHVTDALAAGVFRDEATVKAEVAEQIAQAIEAESAEDDRDEGDDLHRSIHFATCAQLAREIGGTS